MVFGHQSPHHQLPITQAIREKNAKLYQQSVLDQDCQLIGGSIRNQLTLSVNDQGAAPSGNHYSNSIQSQNQPYRKPIRFNISKVTPLGVYKNDGLENDLQWSQFPSIDIKPL